MDAGLALDGPENMQLGWLDPLSVPCWAQGHPRCSSMYLQDKYYMQSGVWGGSAGPREAQPSL
jgi:hypothetical protein